MQASNFRVEKSWLEEEESRAIVREQDWGGGTGRGVRG